MTLIDPLKQNCTKFGSPKRWKKQCYQSFLLSRDETALVSFSNKRLTKSTFVNIQTSLTNTFAVHSSLFFDQKGEFLHFRRFDNQSSVPDVLRIATSSILDTFPLKRTGRCQNDMTDPLLYRPRRNLFERDFRSSGKYPSDWVPAIAESHSSTVRIYHLIQIIIRKRADTHNLISSDRL